MFWREATLHISTLDRTKRTQTLCHGIIILIYVESMKLKQFEKVNGLDCYFYKSMSMRDRRMRENSKYAPRASLTSITLWLLHIIAFGSVHQSSFEFFVSIHLTWLSILRWPESCQHINQFGRHRLTVHFGLLISASRHSLQWYNRSLLSESSFKNPTK